MGLDMFVYCNSKRVCKEVNDQTDEWEGKFQTPRGIAIQWRNANAIHKWFVDNVQDGQDDCGTYEVSITELAGLHDTCKAILESTELEDAYIENGKVLENGKLVQVMEKGQRLKDTALAEKLLPTQDGFFFGSTAYDQWYWLDLEYTVDKIAKLMENLVPAGDFSMNVAHKNEPDWFVRFYYHSSW